MLEASLRCGAGPRRFTRRGDVVAAGSPQLLGRLFIGLVAGVAAGCAHRPVAAAPAHPIVVAMVIDQFGAWIADERMSLLPADGGFARLRREGTYVRDMRYAHAITETAPGHAALYTGCPPWKSGIVANEDIDPTGKPFPYLLDPRTHELSADGPLDRPSDTLDRLTCATVSDAFKMTVSGAQVISLSIKDRGSLLPAGRRADAALWYDPKAGNFVTSSWIAETYPAWAKPFTDRAAIAAAHPATWELLDPTFVLAHAATVDLAPGEGDYLGLGVTFPHPIGGKDVAGAFRTTPYADALLLGLASQAIAAAGAPANPLLLELSISSPDLIGHVYGPDSWEAWDELLRLDGQLGQFFSRLDAVAGPEGWSLILSADHGVPPLPEATPAKGWPWCQPGAPPDRWQRPCAMGRRVVAEAVLPQLRISTELALGPGRWVSGFSDPYVALTAAGRALSGPRRALLDHTIHTVLERQPGVAQVFDVAEIAQPCPPETDESLAALVCRSVVPGRVGDYYVVAQPGSFFDQALADQKGTAHGSPYLFDRAIPLLVRIPGKVAAGAVIDGPVSFRTFTRSVALALGIDFPPAVDGSSGAPGLDLALPAPFSRRGG